MAKKAKWLEEGTQESLLLVIKETLSADEVDPKAQKKALNATNELIERLPSDEITIVDNIDTLVGLANIIKEQYNNEADMLDESAAIDAEEDEEETDAPEIETEKDLADYTKKELIAMAKELGLKVNKKMAPADIIALIEESGADEEDSDDEEEESEATDIENVLAELDLKTLRKLSKEAGINIKGKKLEALADELAAHDDIEDILAEAGLLEDEEDDTEDDTDMDYTELSKTELKALLKERGFKVSKKATVEEMIETLENN